MRVYMHTFNFIKSKNLIGKISKSIMINIVFGHLLVNKVTNKKPFQCDAYSPLAHRMCFNNQTPNVSTGWGCPQVNKFEQVSSLGHQLPLAGDGGLGESMVRFNASWIMVSWGPPVLTSGGY